MSDAPCPRPDCEGTLEVLPAAEEPTPQPEPQVGEVVAKCTECGFLFARSDEGLWEEQEPDV